MSSVNPDVLVWARETAGLSPEAAARKLGFTDSRKRSGRDRLLAIEAGEETPSRSVLNRMAKAYRRSLLALMLPARPRMADRGEDFRTLPEALPPEDNALIDALIRNVRARQAILRAAILDDEDFVPRAFVGSRKIAEGVARLVQAVEQLLGYSATDFRREADADAAFGALRSRVEAVGVFVVLKGDLGNYHTAIEVDAFRGFAVADDVAPFIVINDNDSRRAWSFTLIHELVHLLLGQTGISGLWADNQVEQFCNRVAGEYLLPEAELRNLQIDVAGAFEAQMERIGQFAGPRNVSSTMIAYKLYLAGRIDFDYWVRAGRHFKQLWRESRQERRKGTAVNYYVVRQHRVGKSLIGTVDRLISEGSLTETEGAKVLDVRANKIQALIDAA
jgi:Zn-dependent peptidase ImmA (M78 family)